MSAYDCVAIVHIIKSKNGNILFKNFINPGLNIIFPLLLKLSDIWYLINVSSKSKIKVKFFLLIIEYDIFCVKKGGFGLLLLGLDNKSVLILFIFIVSLIFLRLTLLLLR